MGMVNVIERNLPASPSATLVLLVHQNNMLVHCLPAGRNPGMTKYLQHHQTRTNRPCTVIDTSPSTYSHNCVEAYLLDRLVNCLLKLQ